MANNPKQSDLMANDAANAALLNANSGKLRIYDGTQPANTSVAVTTQNLLAELTLNATAFGAAVAGVATANAITADTSADASGTASWFRITKSDGITVLWDGSVDTASADCIIDTTTITAGVTVAVASLTYTIGKG